MRDEPVSHLPLQQVGQCRKRRRGTPGLIFLGSSVDAPRQSTQAAAGHNCRKCGGLEGTGFGLPETRKIKRKRSGRRRRRRHRQCCQLIVNITLNRSLTFISKKNERIRLVKQLFTTREAQIATIKVLPGKQRTNVPEYFLI